MILFLSCVFTISAGCWVIVAVNKALESSKMKRQIAEYEKNHVEG